MITVQDVSFAETAKGERYATVTDPSGARYRIWPEDLSRIGGIAVGDTLDGNVQSSARGSAIRNVVKGVAGSGATPVSPPAAPPVTEDAAVAVDAAELLAAALSAGAHVLGSEAKNPEILAEWIRQLLKALR